MDWSAARDHGRNFMDEIFLTVELPQHNHWRRKDAV